MSETNQIPTVDESGTYHRTCPKCGAAQFGRFGPSASDTATLIIYRHNDGMISCPPRNADTISIDTGQHGIFTASARTVERLMGETDLLPVSELRSIVEIKTRRDFNDVDSRVMLLVVMATFDEENGS